MSDLTVGVKVGYDGRELSAGVDGSRRKLAELAGATRQNELSARQMSAALRGVPAQFTDIVTALQSGQRPLTVLLQQGGQLKDMFGGAVPAARALGGYIAGLINPLTIAGATVGVLAAGLYKGRQEAQEFQRALILTGNAAGTTAAELSRMRDAVAAATGATKGAAAEAIAELASTGKVTESAMQGAAQAAVAMSRTLGVEVSDTVKAFAELGKSPAQAIRKLNEQYNFLHAAQLQQIDNLEAVGQKTEAVRLAQDYYADALKSMAAEAQQNLGYVERAWNAIKDAAKGAADAVANIGREKGLSEQLDEARKKLEEVRAQAEKHPRLKIDVSPYEKLVIVLEAMIAGEKQAGEIAEANNARKAAGVAWYELVNRHLSKTVELEQKIARIRAAGAADGSGATPLDVARAEVSAVKSAYGIATRSDRKAEQLAAIRAINEATEREVKALRAAGAAQNEVNAALRRGAEAVDEINKRYQTGAQNAGRAMRAALEAQIDLAAQLASVTQKAQSERIRAAVALGEMSEREAIIAQARAAEDKLNAEILASRQKLAGASRDEAAKLNVQIEVLNAERLAAQQKLNDDLRIVDQKAYNEDLTWRAEAARRAGELQTAYVLEWTARHRTALGAAIKSGNDELAKSMHEAFNAGLGRARLDEIKQRYEALFADMTRQIEDVRYEAGRDGGVLAGFAADARVAEIRDKMIPQLQLLIDKMREAGAEPLVTEKTVSESTRAIRKITDESDAAWRSFCADIERGLTDSLYRSFESGKGFGQSFIDAIKNLFKTTVLKIAVQGTVQGGLDLIGLGGSSGGSKLGSLGNIFSLGKNAYEIYSGNSVLSGLFGFGKTLGGGLTVATAGGVGAGLSFAGAGVSGALGGGIGGGALGSGVSGSVAGGMGGGIGGGALGGGVSGSIASSAGSSGLFSGMSTLGWVGLGLGAVAAIASALGKKRGGAKTEGNAFAILNEDGSLSMQTSATGPLAGDWRVRGGAGDQAVADLVSALGTSASTLIKRLGGSPGGLGINLGFNTDPKGTAPDNISGALTDAAGNYYYRQARDAGRGSYQTELQLEVQRLMLGAVRAADVAQVYKDVASSVDLMSAGADQIAAALADIGKIADIRVAFGRVNLSVDAVSRALIEAAGGADSLSASLSDYYDGYFSDAEKTQKLGELLAGQFAALNLVMPQTRAGFRALVEGLDSTGAAGQQALAALLGMSSSFGQWADAAGRAAAEAAAAAEAGLAQLRAESRTLEIDLLRAQGRLAEAEAAQRALDTDGMTDAARAVYDYNRRLREQVDALESAAASLAQLRSETATLEIELLGAQGRIAEAAARQRQIDTAGMTAEAIAAYDHNADLRRQIEAQQAANAAASTHAARIEQFFAAQRQAQEAAQEAQRSALNDQVSAARQVAETFARIVEALKQYRASLLTSEASPASPVARYDEARAQYRAIAARARLGDADAANRLQDAVDTFLAASREANTDAAVYRVDFAEAVGALDQVIGVAGRRESVAQQQLSVAQQQLSVLNAISASLAGGAGASASAPLVVKNYGQLANDWEGYFRDTRVGQTVKYSFGTTQRLSEDKALFTDHSGKSFVFSRGDPYALIDQSEAWRKVVKDYYGQWTPPKFAAGGAHAGGWRIVGEHGPELEYTPPSRIYSNTQSRSLFDVSALVAEIKSLRDDLRAGQAQSAHNTGKIVSLLDRVSRGGDALRTEVA